MKKTKNSEEEVVFDLKRWQKIAGILKENQYPTLDEKQSAYSVLSDTYKDLHGIRPRGIYNFYEMSLEDIEKETERLHKIIQREMEYEREREAIRKERDKKDFLKNTENVTLNDKPLDYSFEEDMLKAAEEADNEEFYNRNTPYEFGDEDMLHPEDEYENQFDSHKHSSIKPKFAHKHKDTKSVKE
jgi:hypothetical protein